MTGRRGRHGATLRPKSVQPRIVVLTEDTEGVRDYLDLRIAKIRQRGMQVDIRVSSSRRSSAQYILRQAAKLVDGATNAEREADYVFLVFDRDSQGDDFVDVRNKAERNPRLEACAAVPCFEYWFLIHKDFDLTPYKTQSEVLKKIQRVFSTSYRKSKIDIIVFLEKAGGDEADARRRAIRGRQELLKTGAQEPWTEMDILLEQIEEAIDALRSGKNPIVHLQEKRYGQKQSRL